MNEKIDINVKTLSPFKKFCMTIGELPSSYVETMSYYEMLMWFTKYLTDTVIPTINNNAEAVEEVQNIVMELQDFMNNYFDNLDVQEEINNKLDSMVESGELQSIINTEIFSDINNKILQNTVDISANSEELETCVKHGETNSVTMNMLNQEVKTALTGGSTAVVGEDSIGDENIQDKAISIYKLDDYLQSTKSISYGDPIELGTRYAGFIKDDNGVATVVDSDQYSHLKVNLTKDKIYSFSGYNVSLSCGLVVVDSDDNIIYNSNPDASSSNPRTPTSLTFKVLDTGLKAYISIWNNLYDVSTYEHNFLRYNSPVLREIEIFTNNFKKIEPKLIKTINGTYAGISHDSDGLPQISIFSSTNEQIYEMVKGMHYKVSGYNWSQAVGIYILGLDNSIIYQSSDQSVGGTHVGVTRDFTATQDGYFLLLEHGNYKPTIEIVYDLIDNTGETQEQNLGFSKWYALGDSLTEVNFRASSNYAKYISDELDITLVNLGHSSCGYKHENSNNQTFITEIQEISSSYDYESEIITVMGSINDFQYITNNLGQLGDTTTDTLYGAMYSFCNSLFTRFIGARIGIICPPATGTYNTDKNKFTLYNKALKETAELFAIPVLDLSDKCNLKPWITNFKNTFFSADGTGGSGEVDTTHPNSKGHWLMHNVIKEFIKTL